MKIVFFIFRMNFIIQILIRGLNSKQITMCTGFKPAAVGLFGLLAQRKRDSEASVVDFLDFLDEIFDFIDEFLIIALTALNCD